MHHFDSPLVVKVGGARGVGGTQLLDDLTEAMPPASVLVHGGSDRATRLAERLGRPARFIESPDGRTSRRTDREDLEVFAMATALVNRELVEGLARRGRSALGLSGLDGGLARARRKATVRSVESGRTRIVRDQWTGRTRGVDGELLRALVATGRLPVIAPLAAGESGEMLNTDADRLAAHVAIAAGAQVLVLLTNVPGIAEEGGAGVLIRQVAADGIDRLEAAARGRMRAKVDAARLALEGGVRTVIVADGRCERPLTDALSGAGTVIGASLAGEVAR